MKFKYVWKTILTIFVECVRFVKLQIEGSFKKKFSENFKKYLTETLKTVKKFSWNFIQIYQYFVQIVLDPYLNFIWDFYDTYGTFVLENIVN